MMGRKLEEYLADPLLASMYGEVRRAGALRSISVDLTHDCNLRCDGCYFYSEQMDRRRSPADEGVFDGFVARERARGTNFVTVVGGEPSLSLGRLKKLYDAFHINVATNGIRRIPLEGFENLPIGIAVWGGEEADTALRGGGRRHVFAEAMKNYRDDDRAFWYYTTIPGRANEIEGVVGRCVENGNRVLFNFFSDVRTGGRGPLPLDAFDDIRREIDRMIVRYPEHILMTSYVNNVVSTGLLYGSRWGYDVCTSLSADSALTDARRRNGNPYASHFRAFNADLLSTRRCCTADRRVCDSCFDVWQHFSWIILNLKKHLGTKEEFTQWLTTMYLFYLINRLVDYEKGMQLLPVIHELASGRCSQESALMV